MLLWNIACYVYMLLILHINFTLVCCVGSLTQLYNYCGVGDVEVLIKEFPTNLQGWIQLLLGNGKDISL